MASPARRVLCILKRTGLAFIDDNVENVNQMAAGYFERGAVPLVLLTVEDVGGIPLVQLRQLILSRRGV